MTRCPGCGFTYGEAARPELGAMLCVSAGASAPRLAADLATVRWRSSPEEWSPREDEPSFKPMYRNERVAIDRILRGE